MNGDGFIDRSKVRILLCDNDATNSEHVLRLLINCSYKVTSVKSARQVIDALNDEGPDIDMILTEVDLPMAKGMKMLKYITRDKDLRRIPVIMMSAQDEVSTVVKCLRLGAADYLVKPLRTNELLNLWTHMWRRRHMLGLAEKNVIIYDIDVVGSDPSDGDTTSTTFISDETDDKSHRIANPEIGMSKHHGEVAAAPVASVAAPPPFTAIFGYRPCVPGISDRRTGVDLINTMTSGKCSLGPKKSELKIGESSAFFTYVKSSILKDDSHETTHYDGAAVHNSIIEEGIQACSEQEGYNTPAPKSIEKEEYNTSAPKCSELGGYCTPAAKSCEPREQRSSPVVDSHVIKRIPDSQSKEEESSPTVIHQRNQPLIDIATLNAHAHASYSYFMHGMMNQAMMPPPSQMFQKNFHQAMQNHGNSPLVPQYGHFPHHIPGMGLYPYFPVDMCLQPGQVASTHQWPSYGPPSAEVKGSAKVDRREAALIKFRQKRKERCFDKKIRYVNRKKLAEKRPRVRGQFVRKNGFNVDLNGQPTSVDCNDDEEVKELCPLI